VQVHGASPEPARYTPGTREPGWAPLLRILQGAWVDAPSPIANEAWLGPMCVPVPPCFPSLLG